MKKSGFTTESHGGPRRGVFVAGCAVVAVGFAAATGGCKEYPATTSAAEVEAAPATTVVVNFKVEGLHCHGCAASARNAISKVDGVRRCNVSFDSGTAEVVMDIDEQDEILAQIVDKVTDLGFTIERSDET